MNIVFLCTSLQPGKDGVGDYTRRIAFELINQGHFASAISLNDKFISNKLYYTEKLYNCELPLLRLPENWSLKERLKTAKNHIDDVNPDLISLQFVIYGFHSKGIPFGLSKKIASLGTDKRWHIMFHEIWTGISTKSPLKHKLYGHVQKKIIKSIIKELSPDTITTSNRLYQIILAENNIKSELLPLFSNISISNCEDFITNVSEQMGYKNNQKQIIIGIFGTLYSQANLEAAIEKQLNLASLKNKELIFISIGRIGNGLIEFNRLKELFSKSIRFVILGELPEEHISALFQIMKFGISCTPVEHLGKSGVFAAMRYHSLDVITPINDHIPEYDDEIKKYNKYLFQREPYKWGVKYATKKFLKLIKDESKS